MAGRIVLFGATGYTGRLTAEAHGRARAAARAGRAQRRQAGASSRTSSAEASRPRAADVADPRAWPRSWRRATCSSRPSARSCAGARAAASAAIARAPTTSTRPASRRSCARCSSATARPPRRRGIGMLTAFGYDWVPGNLAGALALREAGRDAIAGRHRLLHDRPASRGSMSGGTRASLVGVIAEPELRLPRRADRTERGATRDRTLPVGGQGAARRVASAAPSTSRSRSSRPQLREVNAYLGWFGPASRRDAGDVRRHRLAFKLPGVRARSGAPPPSGS